MSATVTAPGSPGRFAEPRPDGSEGVFVNSGLGLAGGIAAVHHEAAAGDETWVVRGKEEHCLGHFIGPAETAQMVQGRDTAVS
jgi:hypothetical protein